MEVETAFKFYDKNSNGYVDFEEAKVRERLGGGRIWGRCLVDQGSRARARAAWGPWSWERSLGGWD